MDWNYIVKMTLIAVFSTTILAVLGWGISPFLNDPQPVKAKINHIQMPNLFYRLPEIAKTEKEMPLVKLIRVFQASPEFNEINFSSRIHIGSIELSNTSDERSGAIEIIVEDGFAIKYADSHIPDAMKRKIILNQLEPGSDRKLFFVSGSIYREPTVRIIHKNRNVELTSSQIDDALPFFHYLVVKHTNITWMILMFSIVTMAFISIYILFYLLHPDKIKLRAMLTDSNETKKMLETINYLKKHYPEKFPPEKTVSETNDDE